jgi:putative MATE family efflux protein
MGLPSMIGFLTNNIYHLVDMWWVSRLPGEESAVAALTFFGVILMLLYSFNDLIGPGSVAIISRRYGEKDDALTEKAIKETLFLKMFFGAILGITGYFLVERLLRLVGAEGETLRLGVRYAEVILLFLGIPYATYSVFTALRSVANPHKAMFLMLASNVLNMTLDPLFMFGYLGFPRLGIRGAAVASIVSFSLTLGIGLLIFFSGKANVRLHLRGRQHLSVPSMVRLLKIGLPAWLGSLSFSGARTVIAPMIATYGMSVVAAYGVGVQVTGFCVMVIVGIGLGLSSLIGHTVGSRKSERARQTGNQSILLSVGIMLGLALPIAVFAPQFVRLFFDSADTVAHGVAILRIFAVSLPALGLYLMVEEVHIGVGLNTPMMVLSILHSWGLQVLPILLLTQIFDTDQLAVWWTMTISIWISSMGALWYYRRGRWLTTEV